MRKIVLTVLLTLISLAIGAKNVTINVTDRPAAEVFRTIVEQTGMNFVYSSEVLEGLTVSAHVKNRPLKKALSEIFSGTDIEFKIKGKNVILSKKKESKRKQMRVSDVTTVYPMHPTPQLLDEVIVLSRLQAPEIETSELGARKISAEQIRNTPGMFSEPDVIKALQFQPGINEGTEGLAGMHVNGGDADGNLYMLDNVPLYQINHFAGLYSAFNTDIIRNIDFFKSSMPAKYDGRLSSFLDVRLQEGSQDGHHGSARLGFSCAAFNISGPIGDRTTYLVGLRGSSLDLVTLPIFAIINSISDSDLGLGYGFYDINAKLTHRFTNKTKGFVNIYFGDDRVRTHFEENYSYSDWSRSEKDKTNMDWGNLVVQTGVNHRFSPNLFGEFSAAFTRSFSMMKQHNLEITYYTSETKTDEWTKVRNNVNDWIFRGDFDWKASDKSRVRFGANYTRHSFVPEKIARFVQVGASSMMVRDSTWRYGANEFNAYIEDDFRLNEIFRVNAGLHASLFHIEGKTKYGLSPRISANYRLWEQMALKMAYARTTQFVHHLSQSYISLPTDQWVPIAGKFKPSTADKITIGAVRQSRDNRFAFSLEGYFKWMHNLIEYADEYYLHPPFEIWNSRLTQGRGTAKGIDFKAEKLTGKLTGHIAYSLGWADRTFPDKNGGRTYPARFDNRHSINILLNWNISKKVQLNAAWTGHSGNRFTLLTQMWENAGMEVPVKASLNNYRLPFYHRLDLACIVRNKRGYWTYSLYNAYNHMNTVAIRRDYTYNTGEFGKPVFQKVKLLPIIPSISFTWIF